MDHVLRTERLVLRPARANDRAVLTEHWGAPDVRRFLFDGQVVPAEEIAAVITASERDFTGHPLWIIESEGVFVGAAALRPLDELGQEILYSLAPEAWGRGYATEAARAVVDHALGPLGLPEVLAEIDEGNVASVAVVERLGMTPFAVVPGELGPMTRYRARPRGAP
ncbi:GNAT family N-acetyltransferase [Spirillospora sp. NPDC047279]|uniref:GNAT family N-acetyltransferase n=1 Tax=Spirillospora sp. NPDC047279 TaxID=3155478 RepID=UPI0033E186B0